MMIRTTAIRRPVPPSIPSAPKRLVTRSSTIHVLIAHQPVAITNWMAVGREAPRRPKALRLSTICVTPVRWPISTKQPNRAIPIRFPATSTMITSAKERPSATPSAPSTQLMGAMLASAQIQDCCAAVEDRARSGTGSRLCSPVQASGESSGGVDRTATRTSSGERLKPVGGVPWHPTACRSRRQVTALTTGKATDHDGRVLLHDRAPPPPPLSVEQRERCFVLPRGVSVLRFPFNGLMLGITVESPVLG